MVTKMKAKLIKELFRVSGEIRKTDAPGNADADIPAMVMCDLAAVMLAQRQGAMPPINRSVLIDILCGSFSYALERFTYDDLPPEEMLMVRDAIAALDVLSPTRPKVPKHLMQAA